MTGHREHARELPVLLSALGRLADAAGALDTDHLAGASRRPGWSVLQVLVACQLDLQQLLVALLRSSGARPTTTEGACDYTAPAARTGGWHDDDERVLVLRRLAGAYLRPASITGELAESVDSACLAALALREGSVLVGGRLVCTGDLLLAWSTRLAEHAADLPVSA